MSSALVISLTTILVYVDGALRATAEFTVGNSSRALLSECASKSNCSIPACEISLHFRMLLKNLFIKFVTNFEQNCV